MSDAIPFRTISGHPSTFDFDAAEKIGGRYLSGFGMIELCRAPSGSLIVYYKNPDGKLGSGSDEAHEVDPVEAVAMLRNNRLDVPGWLQDLAAESVANCDVPAHNAELVTVDLAKLADELRQLAEGIRKELESPGSQRFGIGHHAKRILAILPDDLSLADCDRHTHALLMGAKAYGTSQWMMAQQASYSSRIGDAETLESLAGQLATAAEKQPDAEQHGDDETPEQAAEKKSAGANGAATKSAVGRKTEWDDVLEFVANHKSTGKASTDADAIAAYRSKYPQRRYPTVVQLQNARSYQKRKHSN